MRRRASTPTASSLDENLKEQLQEAADTLLAELPARVAIAA